MSLAAARRHASERPSFPAPSRPAWVSCSWPGNARKLGTTAVPIGQASRQQRAGFARPPPKNEGGAAVGAPPLGLVARGPLNDPAPAYVLILDLARGAT